ncbi:Lead, cadmium, zinc and mercury transporting ATPase [Granulicella sibirica]|uniref:Lead, cadmium, zinc and mercury transporting ATPase n=2 Tax=Granulicella sibirica TaxID=2479048 RepID=A0A4Q0SXK9_9BACT|nr:Lead, cadmium, zinc and mercury transporting ATPase [Granulicella sibirica]
MNMTTNATPKASSKSDAISDAESADALGKALDLVGLTSKQAASLLAKNGPNSMPDTFAHVLRNALLKFWAPVPWLLEASMVLQLVLHKYVEAGIIAALLVLNAALAFVQEGRAQATLNALKSRLALNASVLRDATWKIIPAAQLVVGDVVKLSLGEVVAADVHILDGSVELDQSMLTGESLPVEPGAGADTFSGALVRRGEASARVTATGTRTKFGQTAELVRTAHAVSSQQRAVLKIVRNLAFFNGGVILLMGIYALSHSMPWNEVIPLFLTAVLAAIPVGLPATFTLSSAIGARSLATLGVLPTRLSAVDEAGTIDVLCVDKTGTLTANQLSVASISPMNGFNEAQVLGIAALASSVGGEDSEDAAVRSAAAQKPSPDNPKLVVFTAFDPAKKTSEATATDAGGQALKIVKGAAATIFGLAGSDAGASAMAAKLEAQGFRLLGVAFGLPGSLRLIGMIALSDPPRADSASLISELTTLGVRTVMVTGDAPATAAIVATEVGLEGPTCPAGSIPASVKPENYSVFASIPPEGKFALVKAFQKSGHTVGMCGDGANDAPALRQAQIGIAVSTATDVAKSAAGVVLTEAGLGGIVAAIKTGRLIFQRILSYTLRSTTKKIAQLLFLAIGLLMTGQAVITPLLMVIVMITGDLFSMAYATDRVRPSGTPNSWDIGKITAAGAVLGMGFLVFSTSVLAVGKYKMRLDIDHLRTFCIIGVVYGSQAVTYAIRDRQHLWGLRPTKWLVMSTAADILFISLLANRGIEMSPLPLRVLGLELLAATVFYFALNFVKIPVFRSLKLT